MQNPNESIVSRRSLVTATGVGILSQSHVAAQTAAGSNSLLCARIYNVRDFGAKGDGQTLDTPAVQAAIDACTRDKGGTVVVPAGDFIVGTVELKSNVTLHVSAAGRLLGSGKPEHYSAGKGVPPGNGN